MKKLILLLFTATILISCKAKNPITENINEIQFYTYDDQPMKLSDIKKEWRKMINTNDYSFEKGVGSFEIREIADKKNNSKVLALVALNSAQRIQTATIINKYKEGYQMSDRSVSCFDCGTDLQVEFNGENWVCTKENESYTACTKTSRLEY